MAEEKRKKCPFLNEWCIGAQCAQYVTVQRVNGATGIRQKTSLCSVNALGMMLGEIDNKLGALLNRQSPDKKLYIPGTRLN